MSASNSDNDSDSLPDSELGQSLPDGQVVNELFVASDEDEYIPGNDDLRSLSPPGLLRKVAKDVAAPNSPGALSDRTVPILKDNPFVKDPSYLTRNNRWFGPESTWMSYTEEPRLAAQSLDRIRSQDLSLHLYNAYFLNQNTKQSARTRRNRSKGKDPVKSDEVSDEDQVETLRPPRDWTLWPLPPDRVPREPLLPEAGGGSSYRKVQDPRPSAMLEECLIDTTARFARKRWDRRAWQPELGQERQWGIKTEEHAKEGAEEGTEDVAMDDRQGSSREESDAAETIDSDSDSMSDTAGSQIFTSQAYGLVLDDEDIETSKDHANTDGPRFNDNPVPIADDEAVRDLLLPSTRQTLGKLDDLLIGLHKARRAYASTVPRKKPERRTEEKSSGATDTESQVTGIQTPDRKRRNRQASVVSTRSGTSGLTASDDQDQDRLVRRKPNPRDWSDVIGMAALTGWDSTVVERAGERCAKLFGKNMLFRTFHEGDPTRRHASYFTEHTALDDEGGSEPEVLNTENSTSMIRTSQACSQCHVLKAKCEAEEGAEGTSSCKRCTSSGLPCSGIIVKIYSNIGRSCPHMNCERHNVPFKKSSHLQRHLDDVHQNATLQSRPTYSSSPAPQYEPFSPTEIVCPVSMCPRHHQPFSRGTKLYEHLRKMHPEVDIKEIKKLESARRGDKRGRYRDESRRREVGRANQRHRSRSKSAAPQDE